MFGVRMTGSKMSVPPFTINASQVPLIFPPARFDYYGLDIWTRFCNENSRIDFIELVQVILWLRIDIAQHADLGDTYNATMIFVDQIS